MNFRSIGDLSACVNRNLHRLPPGIDIVVGIPRSGMLAASIVALALNRPLAEIDGFAEGRLLGSGTTRDQQAIDYDQLKTVLVVDDSIRTGGSMKKARTELERVTGKQIHYCAIFGQGDNEMADVILEHVAEPRMFGWNVMHHPGILKRACVDIDGILCPDPEPHANDDGERYRDFLLNVPPKVIPTGKIHALVTSRLERYRPETEQWLAKHGIAYERLDMIDLPSAEERRRLANHGSFKASIYAKTPARLFIESEGWQAREIARRTGKPVLHLGERPELVLEVPTTARGLFWRARQSPRLRQIAKSMIGDSAFAKLRDRLGAG